MAKSIFISHANSESDRALAVSALLRAAGLEPVIDTDKVAGGDSFVSFMEEALADCDYCLLLWSAAAAQGDWVKEEWQSAYHRSVTTGQSFLVVGRLEKLDPPQLLTPRSFIDLFPELEPGIAKLVAMWKDDEEAENAARTPVRPPARSNLKVQNGETVYISSDSFGATFPLPVDFDVPVAVLIENALRYLGAPRQIDHAGRLGCRFEYKLMAAHGVLDFSQSLRANGVVPKSLLTLLIDVVPFAAGNQVAGAASRVTFRGAEDEARKAGRVELLKWVRAIGLGD